MKEKNRYELIKKSVIITLIIINLGIILSPTGYLKSLIDNPKITGFITKTSVTIIEPDYNGTCVINLKQGWNLVSFNCFYDNNSINKILENITGKYDSIFSYVNEEGDKWKSYNPALPIWVIQDLSDISRKRGYWIKMKNDTIYNVTAKIKKQDNFNVYIGWNLISNPTNNTYNISYGLRTIDGKYNRMYMFNATNNEWSSYKIDVINDSGLRDYGPNYGYWINVSSDGEIWLVN